MDFKLNGKPLVFIFLFFCVIGTQAQNATYTNYFNQYKDIAIEQMNQYRIPASITLAQGLLESGAGQSKLAKNANNHFGIKCHGDWNGKTEYHDDDKPGECFRKYKNAKESFLDHSLFLTERPRYARLFTLNIRDYKGWARGLKACGYATDPAYAEKLINIIETYELYQYDNVQRAKKKSEPTPQKAKRETFAHFDMPLRVYKANGLIYVHARRGESFGSIAEELGFKASKLAKYNEVPKDFALEEGNIVYLQKKNIKALKPHYEHKVQGGESMYSIAQKYGIKLSSLYNMNNKPPEYRPQRGDVLRLR